MNGSLIAMTYALAAFSAEKLDLKVSLPILPNPLIPSLTDIKRFF